MAKQESADKSKAKQEAKETEAPQANQETVEKGEELTAELDDLLDEIDDVLEKNAEQFVKDYVQKGGE